MKNAHDGCIVEEIMHETQLENVAIHRLERGEIGRLRAISDQMRAVKDVEYFERNFDYQDVGEREIFITTCGSGDAGYCILNWKPKYAFFRKMEIPETQDLNVLPRFRQRGIGRFMIEYCEARAIEKGYGLMGIGVGLDAGYGAAQRLYTKLGYMPDGNGITYDRQLVAAGAFKPIDDNLCLMMVKRLKL